MKDRENHVAQAAMLIGAAMAIIGFIDNYVRIIAQDAGLWQFHFVRSLMSLSLVLCAAPFLGLRLRARAPRRVLFRSLLTASSILLYFGAVAMVPIATAGAGLFTSPIWVLLISVGLFGMRIGLWRVLAVAVGFAGVLLILRPGSGGLDPFALIAVAAGFLYAAGSLATRRLCADESPESLVWAFFLVLGVFGAIGLAVLELGAFGSAPGDGNFFTTGWQTPTWRFLGLTFMQAVGSLVAVFCLIRAYQMADPSYVAVFEYSFLLFAGLWGFVLWGEFPDLLGVLGILAILLSGSVIILRSRAGREQGD